MRRQAADFRALEADRAGARAQSAGDQIERRALARAVRPDEAEDLALAHFEGHLVDRQESSEALGEPLDRQASSLHGVERRFRQRQHGAWVWILVGQTTEMCSPAFCMTTGVERSFCPESCVPGGKNFTP